MGIKTGMGIFVSVVDNNRTMSVFGNFSYTPYCSGPSPLINFAPHFPEADLCILQPTGNL